MQRFIAYISIALVSSLGLLASPVFGQDALKLQIHEVAHNPILKNDPQLFDVKGVATIPEQTRRKGNFVVLVYTQSDEGGNIQLQMQGSAENGTQQPRSSVVLSFDHSNTASWKVLRIWLGSKGQFDPSYTVYAVVIREFGDDDGKRLIGLTHDRVANFKMVASILEKAGFNPLVYTDKKNVERNE
jgi:hypothetical protein